MKNGSLSSTPKLNNSPRTVMDNQGGQVERDVLLMLFPQGRWRHILGYVESSQGEIDHVVQFAAIVAHVRPAEAFQVQAEHLKFAF